jgi:hypothetical protein
VPAASRRLSLTYFVTIPAARRCGQQIFDAESTKDASALNSMTIDTAPTLGLRHGQCTPSGGCVLGGGKEQRLVDVR